MSGNKLRDRIRILEGKAGAVQVREIMALLAAKYPLGARPPHDLERWFDCTDAIDDMDLPDRMRTELVIWSFNILSDETYMRMFGDKPQLQAARARLQRRRMARFDPEGYAALVRSEALARRRNTRGRGLDLGRPDDLGSGGLSREQRHALVALINGMVGTSTARGHEHTKGSEGSKE